MNKQKNRYTPFKGQMRMPVDEFCKKYGLDLKLVMHRMNTLYWEDFDALVIPQELENLSADKIRRALELKKSGWENDSIRQRLKISEKLISKIYELDEYRKEMFLGMDNYFFLNPSKIDLSKIFTPVEGGTA